MRDTRTPIVVDRRGSKLSRPGVHQVVD